MLEYFFVLCYKELGNQFDYSDLFMTIVGGSYVIFAAIFKIIWGWINGKKGFQFAITCIVFGEVFLYIYIYIYTHRFPVVYY